MLTNDDKKWIRDEIKISTQDIREDVAQLKSDVAQLKSDVAQLKSDVALLKSDVALLKSDVAQLKSDVAEMKDKVESLNDNVVRTNLYLEITLAPLVKELGICYTSAMSDCINRTDEIDEMKINLDACCSLAQENGVKIRCLEAAQNAKAMNA